VEHHGVVHDANWDGMKEEGSSGEDGNHAKRRVIYEATQVERCVSWVSTIAIGWKRTQGEEPTSLTFTGVLHVLLCEVEREVEPTGSHPTEVDPLVLEVVLKDPVVAAGLLEQHGPHR
jgi:hypothetical protein